MAAGLWDGLRDRLVRAEGRSVLDMPRSRASRRGWAARKLPVMGRTWEPSGTGTTAC